MMLEIIGIGSVIFILIPAFFLIKIVFEDFMEINQEKRDYFQLRTQGGKSTIEIDFENWQRKGKHWLILFHRVLIIHSQLFLPGILVILSFANQSIFKYFKIFSICYVLFIFLQ